jgi:hypothetical protein
MKAFLKNKIYYIVGSENLYPGRMPAGSWVSEETLVHKIQVEL